MKTNIVDQFMSINAQYKDTLSKLIKRYHEVRKWEIENIGDSNLRKINDYEKLDIYIDGSMLNISALILDDGYLHHEYYQCPMYKMINDDWKEDAIKKYKEKLEDERISQELEEQAKAIELEIRERAELKRLKEKYNDK